MFKTLNSYHLNKRKLHLKWTIFVPNEILTTLYSRATSHTNNHRSFIKCSWVGTFVFLFDEYRWGWSLKLNKNELKHFVSSWKILNRNHIIWIRLQKTKSMTLASLSPWHHQALLPPWHHRVLSFTSVMITLIIESDIEAHNLPSTEPYFKAIPLLMAFFISTYNVGLLSMWTFIPDPRHRLMGG